VKPDFSGEYVLNRRASTLSAGADAVRSAVLRIDHREPMVRCQATFAFDGKTFEYSLGRVSDGREVVDQQEPTTVSSLHWEGNALVFMDRTKRPDSELTMSWRYELLEVGASLEPLNMSAETGETKTISGYSSGGKRHG